MSGLIAKKVGMSRVFLPTGEAVPVTYLQIEPNVIVRTKTKEKDGYDAVVLGVGKKLWKSRKGKENVRYANQKEWKLETLDGIEAGKTMGADMLTTDTLVCIQGISKGKGFQGVMKRWHFAGGPATHGSHFKREPGSVGMRTWPGRIHAGKKMAGRMGGNRVTIKNLKVAKVFVDKNLIALEGAVPGHRGTLVEIHV
jgi:large subunit ribosomal protein L3